MSTHAWAVLLRGTVYTMHLTLDEANRAAAELRTRTQRDSDVSVKARPARAPGWTRREGER